MLSRIDCINFYSSLENYFFNFIKTWKMSKNLLKKMRKLNSDGNFIREYNYLCLNWTVTHSGSRSMWAKGSGHFNTLVNPKIKQTDAHFIHDVIHNYITEQTFKNSFTSTVSFKKRATRYFTKTVRGGTVWVETASFEKRSTLFFTEIVRDGTV